LESDTSVFASFIMASCSIARVENLSISRRRSVGLEEGAPNAVLTLDEGVVSACFDFVAVSPSEAVRDACTSALPFAGCGCAGALEEGGSSLTLYILRDPEFRPTRTLSPDRWISSLSQPMPVKDYLP
jgi:hypothetical protein